MTRQRNIFSAMMENYADVLEYTTNAYNAQGTAEQKYEHYMDSLEAKINELSVTWEQFIQDFNIYGYSLTEVFSTAISAADGLLKVISTLANNSMLQGIVSSFIGLKVIKSIVPMFLSFATTLTKIGKLKFVFSSLIPKNIISNFRAMNNVWKSFNNTISLSSVQLSAYQKQQALTIVSSRKLTVAQKESQITALGLSQEDARLIVANATLGTSLQTLGGQYKTLNTQTILNILNKKQLTTAEKETEIQNYLSMSATNGLTTATVAQAGADAKLIVQNYGVAGSAGVAATAMTALNIAMGAITLVAGLVFGAIMAVNQANEEARQKASEAATAYKEEAGNAEDLVSQYKELREQLDTQDLSLSEQVTIKDDILNIQQQLVDLYGEEINKIDLVNGNLDTQLEKIKNITKAEAERQLAVMTKDDKQQLYNATEWRNQGNRTYQTTFSDLEIQEDLEKIGFNFVDGAGDITFSGSAEEQERQITAVLQAVKKIQDNYKPKKEDYDGSQDIAQLGDIINTLGTMYSDLNTETTAQYESILEGTGFARLVYDDKSELFSNYQKQLDAVNQAISSGATEVIDPVTKETKSLSYMEEQLKKTSKELENYSNSITKEEEKSAVEYVLGDVNADQKEIDKALALRKQLENLSAGTKKAISQHSEGQMENALLLGNFDEITQSLKNSGIEATAEEIAEALANLGYTFQEVKKQTYGELISSFPEDEESITSAVDNLTTLQEVIEKLSTGEMPEMSKINNLQKAGIDTLALLSGDNTDADFEKIKQDFIQTQLDKQQARLDNIQTFKKENKDLNEEEIKNLDTEISLIQARIKVIKQAQTAIQKTSSEYISSMKSAQEQLISLNKMGDTPLSDDVLSELESIYDGMKEYTEKYRMGLVTNDTLVKAFEKFYEQDKTNYIDYMKSKYANSDQYYAQWKSENSVWVDDFKKQYDIDLRQFANFQDAKAKILQQSTSLNQGTLSDWVNLDTGEYTDQYNKMSGDLYKFMPELAKTVDAYHDIFVEGLISETKVAEEGIIDEMDNLVGDMTSIYLESVESAYTLLYDLGQDGNKITRDVLDNMAEIYPEMQQYVNQYLSKQMTGAELITKFREAYETDKKNYIDYIVEKNKNSATFYGALLKKNATWVKDMKIKYGVDLKEYTTYLGAKQALTDAFNAVNGDDASKYIDMTTGEWTEAWTQYRKHATFATSLAGEDSLIALQQLLSQVNEDSLDMAEVTAAGVEDVLDGLLDNATNATEDAISNISTYLSAQVDIWSELINGITSAASIEIDALNREKDLLEQKNEQQQRAIELQEKLEALNKAKTQRNVREYNAETGEFEWTTNKKDIKDAQRAYDEAMQKEQIDQIQDKIDVLQAYSDSFSSVEDSVEKQRAMDKAIQVVADKYYKGDTSKVDLTNLTEAQQKELRSSYADVVAQSKDFEDMQTQKTNKETVSKIVNAGYGSLDKSGNLIIDPKAISKAMGVAMVDTTGNYDDILKSTSFAETKPVQSSTNVTNVTNTGAVSTSYLFSGDMTFKFDKVTDVDGFISEFVTKLEEKVAITPIA